MLTSETFCRAGINVFKKCSRLTDCSEIQTHNYLVRKRKWPVWLNGWLFVYELNGCGFESHCSHLNFRYQPCFEQGVPWHSGNYIVTSLEHTVIALRCFNIWSLNIQISFFIQLYAAYFRPYVIFHPHHPTWEISWQIKVGRNRSETYMKSSVRH